MVFITKNAITSLPHKTFFNFAATSSACLPRRLSTVLSFLNWMFSAKPIFLASSCSTIYLSSFMLSLACAIWLGPPACCCHDYVWAKLFSWLSWCCWWCALKALAWVVIPADAASIAVVNQLILITKIINFVNRHQKKQLKTRNIILNIYYYYNYGVLGFWGFGSW